MKRQLIASDEARPAKRQHTKPCSDCPWARTALNGWLGSQTAEEWLANAHGCWAGKFVGEQVVECHAHTGVQCAGIAIYRSNMCKQVRKPNIELPPDKKLVFASPMEFLAHHAKPLKLKKPAEKKPKPGWTICKDCRKEYKIGMPHLMFCESHLCERCGTSFPEVLREDEEGGRICEHCRMGADNDE